MDNDDDRLWAEIGRIVMYGDDWSAIDDPVAIELACQDVLEVEVERSRCRDAQAMLAGLGIML